MLGSIRALLHLMVIPGTLASMPAAARAGGPVDLEALRDADRAVLTVGYRLATSAVRLCPKPVPALGLELHDLGQYGIQYRAAAAGRFGLGRWPGVLALAQGGQAANAGVREDDAVVAVDGSEVPAEQGFARVQVALRQIDEAARRGAVELDLRRRGQDVQVWIQPTPACPTHFQTRPSSDMQARADGSIVEITTGLVGFTHGADELAAVLAHELAHNILHHRESLAAAGASRGLLRIFGRSARLIRDTEDEADRLSVYLVDRAGYRPSAILLFWQRFRHTPGALLDATHAPDAKRVATISAEIGRLETLKRAGVDPLSTLLQRSSLPPG